jgi:hypothetical protein
MALGIADRVWTIGDLIDAAMATQPITLVSTTPDRRKRFRIIEGGRDEQSAMQEFKRNAEAPAGYRGNGRPGLPTLGTNHSPDAIGGPPNLGPTVRAAVLLLRFGKAHIQNGGTDRQNFWHCA